MKQDTSEIKLNSRTLKKIIIRGANKRKFARGGKDRHATRQVGLFFSKNLWMSEIAVYITDMTLTPSPKRDEPPQAVVEIVFAGAQTILTTNESGQIPIPTGLRVLMRSMPKHFPSAGGTHRMPKNHRRPKRGRKKR